MFHVPVAPRSLVIVAGSIIAIGAVSAGGFLSGSGSHPAPAGHVTVVPSPVVITRTQATHTRVIIRQERIWFAPEPGATAIIRVPVARRTVATTMTIRHPSPAASCPPRRCHRHRPRR